MTASRRRWIVGVGAAGAAGLSSREARAAEPVLRVRVDRKTVEVGRPVTVEVEVKSDDRGRAQEPGDPIMPDLPGLKVSFRSSGMSRSMTYRNGLMSAETTRTFVYSLTPLQPGAYPLKIGVNDGGKVVFAKELVTLTAEGAAMAGAGSQDAQAPVAEGVSPSSERLSEEVFAQIVTNKKRAYVGEAITAQWEVWQRVTANIEVDMLPVFKDFYAVELKAGEALEQFVGGRQWRVHPAVRRILFPQKSGKLRIGGGTLTVSPTSGFGLFSRPRGRAFTVRGEPVEVEVLPLPAKNQPAGFSANNVGSYVLSIEVDRRELEQGEALTATFTIAGDGNLKVFDPGEWPTPAGMRSYPPKENFEQRVRDGKIYGVRKFEVLYVADTAGTIVFPAKQIDFFEPESAKYRVSKSASVRVNVRPRAGKAPSAGGDVDAAGAAPLGPEADALAEQDQAAGELSPVLGAGALERGHEHASWLTTRRWKTGMLTVPGVGATALSVAALARRMRPSAQTLEARRYRSQAKELLARARAGVEGGAEFEATLGALVQAAAVRKAGDEAVGRERSRLLEALRSQGCAEADVSVVGETLDACDAARYGAAAREPAERARLLRGVESLLRSWGVV